MGTGGKHNQISGVRSETGRNEITEFKDHELLDQYLTLSEENRDKKFPDTAYAANLVGLSRRTIQFWVETGAVRAVFIGRKCRVSTDSLREYLKRREIEHRH